MAMCKVYNAQVIHNVVDRALQVHGSLGYSADMPLEYMYRMARMAPLVDGANEVHKVTIAKQERSRYQGVERWPSEHVPTRLEVARERFSHLLETVG
jgi:acyl-CoA dehydrogenase